MAGSAEKDCGMNASAPKSIRVFGLTGGIGCGKSAVAACFARRGVPVIEADAVGHEVLEPGGLAEAPVLALFGESVLGCGKIDRGKLAGQVFGDPGKLGQLNALVHPIIGAEIARRLAALDREGCRIAVVAAALWAESGQLEPWMDALILVSCSEAIRLRRLVEQRGMDEREARERIAAQKPPEEKRAIAWRVIENEDSLDGLQARVDECLEAMHAYG